MREIFADLLKDAVLHRRELIGRAEDGRLQLFQLFGDVAFAVGKRLLAYVGLGHKVDLRLCDLEIVAEYTVVADPHVFDAGLLFFARLDLLDIAGTVLFDGTQFVNLRIIAVLDDTALADGERGVLIVDRLGKQLSDVVQRVKRCGDLAEFRRIQQRDLLLHLRQHRNAAENAEHVARVGRTVGDARHQALKIKHRPKRRSQLLPRGEIVIQCAERRLPPCDLRDADERVQEPCAQKARAHRGLGVIQHPEERALLVLCPHGLGDLQIAVRVDVKFKILPVAVNIQLLDKGDVGLLRLFDIVEQRTDRAGALAAQPLRAVCGKLRMDDLRRVRFFKAEALVVFDQRLAALGQERIERRRASLCDVDQNLTRRIGRQLILQADVTLRACTVCGVDPPGRDVGKADGGRSCAEIDSREEVVLLVREQRRVGHSTRRDDLDDLPLDKPFGKRGILHLLTDGDLIPFFHKPPDIDVRFVKRNAAHRRALLHAAVSAGQRQLQLARGGVGILEKHLIEVAEAVHEDKILVLILYFKVLLHHRGIAHRKSPRCLKKVK